MSEKLSHLSDKEIKDLIRRYYDKEKVSDLLKEYNIKLRPSQLVKHLPPEILDEKCIYCDLNLIKPRQSRDYYWSEPEAYCPNCKHENDASCTCENCSEIRRRKRELERLRKQEILDQVLRIEESSKVDLDSLTFTQKVYLGALLREGISEDFNYIKPIRYYINPLSPTSELQSEILDTLIKANIIVVHPDTDPEYTEITDAENCSFRYYPSEVLWYVNVKKEGFNKVPLIESIIMPTELSEDDYGEALLLWKKISLHESIEYFQYSVKSILGIDYIIGDKTVSVLRDLLNDYSVSQIYGIIYRSTNNALRFQVEKGTSRKHAANTIIGSAQSYGERAKVKKWDLQKYNRIRECPESALSKFFYERILKIGYEGFYQPPNMSLINNSIEQN
jgi:hypothetical protein